MAKATSKDKVDLASGNILASFPVPRLMKCKKCGEYTLNPSACPKCGGEVYAPKPPKYSPHDKYAKYRRAMKDAARKSVV